MAANGVRLTPKATSSPIVVSLNGKKKLDKAINKVNTLMNKRRFPILIDFSLLIFIRVFQFLLQNKLRCRFL